MPQPRLDDLQYKGLYLYQSPDLPRFSQDSVLLAAFADIGARDIAIDLGAGTGALCTLCAARTGARFAAVEKEAALCELLRQSIQYNGMDIPVHEMDWRDAPNFLGSGIFTAAICNPPYFAAGTQSPNTARAAARGGADALTGAAFAASRLVKNGGKLFICYPSDRLAELIITLRAYRLEPKRMRLVANDANASPYLALIMAKLNARPGMTIEPALLLRDAQGKESDELRAIYHMDCTVEYYCTPQGKLCRPMRT